MEFWFLLGLMVIDHSVDYTPFMKASQKEGAGPTIIPLERSEIVGNQLAWTRKYSLC